MASKQHDWTQDANLVYINIPISGVSLKKIDVYISDLVLKVNVKANNFVKIFDFPHEVDYKSRENKITYNDGLLEVAIKKVQPQTWDNLTAQGLSKEEIRTRREESLKRREEEEKQIQSQRDTLKTQFDRLATEQHMKLESMERDTIEDRKRLEREQAEHELYSQLDAHSNFKTTQESKEERREVANQVKAASEEQDIFEDKAATTKTTTKAKNNDIFEADSVPYSDQAEEKVKAPAEQPVKKEEPKTVALPEPRKAGSVPVKFTEKMYPHMAAREQHLKEPPFPKTTQIKKGEKDEETENPIWLKEKADEFFKNQDYLSAINAYSSAYRKNNDMIDCIANRTLCYLNLFDYENCIQDCDLLLESLAKQTEESQKSKKLKLKTNIRKGIALSWKGSLDEAKGVFEEQLKYVQDENQDPNDRKTLEEYIQQVETRINLNNIKQRGDLALGKANVEEAKKIYESILEQDPNHEIVKANLSLTLLKLNDHEQAVKQCDEVLNILQSFKSTTQIDLGQGKSWNEFKTFVVKILLRRSTALESLERHNEVVKDVEQALLFQAENAQAKKAQYRLRAVLARKEVESIKEEANALLKEKKVDLALQKYDECLKKIQPTDLVPYLGILLNKCTCHLFKNEYEEITSICIRGLRLISNHKQKVISFADKSEKKELNDKLKDYEIRFLVRRGNAYLKTKKFYHAKSDLEEALKLDPQNAQIKQDLQSLNEAIAEK